MPELEREIYEANFGDCLEVLDFEANYQENPVNVTLVYIPFREGEIDKSTFLEYIKSQVIRKFVISCREVKKFYARRDELEADNLLYEKALRKFTRHTAKGKLGELLLYMFIEVLLGAPKILSKIGTLDDPNIHVKGADAIHAQYIDGELLLFLGESKMHQVYANACRSVAESLKETLADYQGEFDLIETSIDFPNITEDLENEIVAVLDPYENDDYTDKIHFPCFIGFNDAICKNVTSSTNYEAEYLRIAQRRINTFFGHTNHDFELERLYLFLLPFESINTFTDEFVAALGIED